MTEVLVADAAAVERVRGRSPRDSGKALDPVPTRDGRFYLGPEVLNDPAHEDVREFLRSMSLVALEKLPVYGESEERPLALETAALTKRALRLSDEPLVEGGARLAER